ncbi:hypothetical protein LINGRAHAP2_LOCUS24627 [Linum grandiflorum]
MQKKSGNEKKAGDFQSGSSKTTAPPRSIPRQPLIPPKVKRKSISTTPPLYG